jgi:acyl carrier protein
VTPDDARNLVGEVLARVAPDLDPGGVDPDADLRDDLDFDSMDVLALVEGVSEATGLDIPDADGAAIGTIGEFADYLVERLAVPPTRHR